MRDETFKKVLLIVTVVCMVLTLAHFAYIVNAYQHCSIIYFIAEELW